MWMNYHYHFELLGYARIENKFQFAKLLGLTHSDWFEDDNEIAELIDMYDRVKLFVTSKGIRLTFDRV